MKRRQVLIAGAVTLACGSSGRAQRKFRLGWLHSSEKAGAIRHREAFLAGMRERGYVEGRDFVLDMRHADGVVQRFPALARELVGAKPDVLLGFETTARAMRALTDTIPIVLTTSIDPVAAGLVKSLARPGTNVTGMVDLFGPMVAKHVELLLEVAPKVRRVTLINDRLWSARDEYERFARQTAQAKNLELAIVRAGRPGEIDEAMAVLEASRPQGVIVAGSGGVLISERKRIVNTIGRLGVPAVYAFPIYLREGGGVLSYGPNLLENAREAADFVVRILHGQAPGELPIRQTRKFELAVSVRAARAIGLQIPHATLLRADEVIE